MRNENRERINVLSNGINKAINITNDASEFITVEYFDANNIKWFKKKFYPQENIGVKFSDFNSIDFQHQFEDSILTIEVPFNLEGGEGSPLGNFLYEINFKIDWVSIIIDGTTFSCMSKEYDYSSESKGILKVKAYADEWELNIFSLPTGVKKFKGKKEGTFGYTPKFIMTGKTVQQVLQRLYKDAIFERLKFPVPAPKLVFEKDIINQPMAYGEVKFYFKDYPSENIELNLQNLKGVLDHMNKTHDSYHKPYVVTNEQGLKDIIFYDFQKWDESILLGYNKMSRSLKYNVEFLSSRTTLTGDRRYVNVYSNGFVFAPYKIEEVIVKDTLAGEDEGEEETIKEENRKKDNYPLLNRRSISDITLSGFEKVRLGDYFGDQRIVGKKFTYNNGEFLCSLAFDQEEELTGSGLEIDGVTDDEIDYDATILYHGLETINENLFVGATIPPNTKIGTSLNYFYIQSQYNQTNINMYKRMENKMDSVGITHNPTTDFERVGEINGTILVRYREMNAEYGSTVDYPNIGILYEGGDVYSPSLKRSYVAEIGENKDFGKYIIIKFRKDI